MIGEQALRDHPIIGKFGQGNRNKTDQKLIDLAITINFKILNLHFLKKRTKINRWTWKAPNLKMYEL